MKNKKEITKRGVLWLGQTCNLKCYFCYFRERIDDKQHAEHDFMSLEKAKEIILTLKEYYSNNAVDIQGGEPTIYPYIYELIKYCTDIGVTPTLITNGIVLANEQKVIKFKEAGIKDFLFSLHALGDTYDEIVGVKDSYKKQIKALENLKKHNIPTRINCTLTKEALSSVYEISKIAIDYNIKVVNFIVFNPFADQQGKREVLNVPRYSDVKSKIEEAIDLLEKHNIEVNIRYMPLCILEEKYRKNIYNMQQIPYDSNEWDFNSWSWTTRFNQRSNSEDLDTPIPILMYNINKYNGVDFSEFSKFGSTIHYHKERTEEFLLKLFSADIPKELLYKNNAKLRAKKHLKYTQNEICKECSLVDICDGFHGDYADSFSMEEAKSIKKNYSILDSKYYIQNR